MPLFRLGVALATPNSINALPAGGYVYLYMGYKYFSIHNIGHFDHNEETNLLKRPIWSHHRSSPALRLRAWLFSGGFSVADFWG
jgi:hypothetical protein